MWQDCVIRMNARIGGNSFIKLYATRGDPRLKQVTFGSNPMDHQAGECRCGTRNVYINPVLCSVFSQLSHLHSNSEALTKLSAK